MAVFRSLSGQVECCWPREGMITKANGDSGAMQECAAAPTGLEQSGCFYHDGITVHREEEEEGKNPVARRRLAGAGFFIYHVRPCKNSYFSPRVHCANVTLTGAVISPPMHEQHNSSEPALLDTFWEGD